MLDIVKSLGLASAKNAQHGDVETLLQRLLIEVVSANYRYFLHEYLDHSRTIRKEPERWCWPPLLASERQVSGLFAHALSSVCPVSVPEMPITRRQSKDSFDEKSGEKAPNGRIDFYATLGRRSIALELKRVAISTLHRPEGWKILERQWEDVGKQAQQALAYMRKEKYYFPHAVGIGLLVIRVSRAVASSQDEDDARMDAAERFEELLREIRRATQPDFFAAYRPPLEMRMSEGWGESGKGVKVIPGVIFAATVRVKDS